MNAAKEQLKWLSEPWAAVVRLQMKTWKRSDCDSLKAGAVDGIGANGSGSMDQAMDGMYRPYRLMIRGS